LNKALEVRSGNASTYFWRGLVMLDRGRYLEALNDLKRSVALDSTVVRSNLWLGVARQLLGGYEDALLDWERAAALAAAEQDVLLQQRDLAKLALINGQVEQAKLHYRRVLEDICPLDKLQTELGFLRRLARLFSARKDIRSLTAWFEEQIRRRGSGSRAV